MPRHALLESLRRATPAWVRAAVPVGVKSRLKAMLGPRAAPPAGPHELEREHLPRARYDGLWDSLFASSEGARREYLVAHRERYYELFNALAHYLPQGPARPRVLEVGVSEYVLFYRALFPAARLVTIDRPPEHHGADGGWITGAAGAEAHYPLDLHAALPHPGWGNPPLGRFDMIVFTEVLEHLVVNPVELIAALVGLLAPGGRLYLTTPNFLRRENLEKVRRGDNPQAVYPARGQNWDAHHHFREYCLRELLDFAVQAGGEVETHLFSACWDDPAMRGEDPALRSNIVLVIRAAGGR